MKSSKWQSLAEASSAMAKKTLLVSTQFITYAGFAFVGSDRVLSNQENGKENNEELLV